MIRRIGLTTGALGLLLVGAAAAEPQSFIGTVMRVDPGEHVIVFDDGRMVRTTAEGVIVISGPRTELTRLRSGMTVVVPSAQPVATRGNRYVVISQTEAVTALPRAAATGTSPAIERFMGPSGMEIQAP